jgi:uracil-DNA glycosylase
LAFTLAKVVQAERRKYPGDDRPIMIGQAPSKHGDPTKPLTGMPGRRLARVAGMYPLEFYASVVRANLLAAYAGEDGSGDAFPLTEARVSALDAAPELNGRTVVFVGRRVAQSFGCDSEWFDWDRAYFNHGVGVEIRYATIPHPSGRNRWWNDEGNVARAEAFMRELLKEPSQVARLRHLRERCRLFEESRSSKGIGTNGRSTHRMPRHAGEFVR